MGRGEGWEGVVSMRIYGVDGRVGNGEKEGCRGSLTTGIRYDGL